MSYGNEYVSPLGNESAVARLVRSFAFLLDGITLLDLASDQLAKALGAIFVEKITEQEEVPADAA